MVNDTYLEIQPNKPQEIYRISDQIAIYFYYWKHRLEKSWKELQAAVNVTVTPNKPNTDVVLET